MPNDLKKQKFNLFGKKDGCPGEEDLAAYMDNRLSAREMTELQAHLNQCPLCRAVLAATLESRQAPPHETPPLDWIEQAQAMVPKTSKASTTQKSTESIFLRISRFLTLPRLAPVAVTAAAVVMISFYWVNYQPEHMLLTEKTHQAPLSPPPAMEEGPTEKRQTIDRPYRLPAPAPAPARALEPVLSEPTPQMPPRKQVRRPERTIQNENAAPKTAAPPPAGTPEQLVSKPAPAKPPQNQLQKLAQARQNKEAAPMAAAAPPQTGDMVRKRIFKLVQVSGGINHNHVVWLVNHEMAKAEDCLLKAKAEKPQNQHLFKAEFIWQENRIAVSDLSPNRDMAACLLSILNQGNLARPEGKGEKFSLILSLTSP